MGWFSVLNLFINKPVLYTIVQIVTSMWRLLLYH